MASPAIALPNGVSTPVQLANNNPNSTATSNSPNTNSTMIDADVDTAQNMSGTSIKRKRESTDASEKPPNGLDVNRISPLPTDPAPSPSTATKVDKSTIRNYYEVLQSIDPMPSVLKRPLPDPDDSSNEPQAKRKKADDGTPLPSIADKVAQEQYGDVDSIIVDITASIVDNLEELRHGVLDKDCKANDAAIARIIDFKRQAYGIFQRELAYPDNSARVVLEELNSISDLQSNGGGNMFLVLNGEQMRGKPLYSSLQQHARPGDGAETEMAIRTLRESGLPHGVKTGRAIPYSFSSPVVKDKKVKTLGELFPAPPNLPSLQPPKAPKSSTKSKQAEWHYPELTEKSKYRAGSYFSQPLTGGRWLDYSNAAPPSQIMTKQRERALSLAGNKPSSLDLEMSEMESLFRGAFSSFAPSRDDSAAMIPSGTISQTMWWPKVGQRNFERLVEAEQQGDATEEVDKTVTAPVEEPDLDLVQEAIDQWTEPMIDPSLEQACCPKKPLEEMDTDELLQEVSDMIQELISYQKNRNLHMPSSSLPSSRSATTDPALSDMLTNGTPVRPGEEETATYEALKAHLILIISMLPPFAVARLNSDKLDELNISTKIEVRTDEYQGLMEEDEAAARARAAQAATSTPRPVAHRASSSSSNMQYGQQQYHTNRAPMPNAQYYGAQTPVRTPQPAIRGPPQTMPPAAYPPRPPSNAGYRPPNQYPGTGYSTQFNKPPAPYSQPGSYGNTPTQVRPPYQPIPPYSNMGNQTPQARFQSYPPNTQPPPTYHHSQPFQAQHQPHQLQGTPSHQTYNQYTNGAVPIPQRTASPHVSQPPQPHQPLPHHSGYNPVGTPVRQASYGGQPNVTNDPSRRFYPNAGSPAMPTQQTQNPQTPGTSSFHTSLQPHQVQQAMDQAKARFDATKSAQRTNEGMRNSMSGQGQVGAPVGLGGIGLGGDPSRLTAARAGIPQLNSPRVGSAPSAMNGTPIPVPTSNGGPSAPSREA